MKQRSVLLTFYTQGPPYDTGCPQGRIAKRFKRAVSPFFDKYIEFCPRMIREEGLGGEFSFQDHTQWLENHPGSHELGHHNASWAKLGFHAWKPFIIQNTLMREDVSEGDFIIYHDINHEKYPSYLLHPDEWVQASQDILKELKSDVFAPAGLPLYVDVKAFAIRQCLTASSKYTPGVWNGLIVIRKSKKSIQFVDEWLAMCSDLSLLSPLPNPRPHAGTIWHSVDQAMMGLVAAKWRDEGRLPADWPRYCEGDRSFGFAMLDRVLQVPSVLKKAMMFLDCHLALRKTYDRFFQMEESG